MVKVYASRGRAEIAAETFAAISKAGLDKVTFAWAGALDRSAATYYRIQGPTFLIEFDNSQNNANHVHSVFRDFKGDFGHDLLAEHYAKEHKNKWRRPGRETGGQRKPIARFGIGVFIASTLTTRQVGLHFFEKSRRLRGDRHLRQRIRNELTFKKSVPPTGPGAATVDRGRPRMCATRKGSEPRTLPKTKPI